MTNTWGWAETKRLIILEKAEEMMNTWGWPETFNYSGESWRNDEYLRLGENHELFWRKLKRWWIPRNGWWNDEYLRLSRNVNYSEESWCDDKYLEMVAKMTNTWGWAKTFNYSGESWSHDEYLEMVAAMMNTWWILDIWRRCLINLEKVEAMMNT